MEISVKWFDGQYPSFNVNLSANGDDFLSIKGCRIMNGSKGEFVAYPSTKNEKTGKYWNHAWGSDRFNEAVLKKALAERPATTSNRSSQGASPVDMADDLPFNRISNKLAMVV